MYSNIEYHTYINRITNQHYIFIQPLLCVKITVIMLYFFAHKHETLDVKPGYSHKELQFALRVKYHA